MPARMRTPSRPVAHLPSSEVLAPSGAVREEDVKLARSTAPEISPVSPATIKPSVCFVFSAFLWDRGKVALWFYARI